MWPYVLKFLLLPTLQKVFIKFSTSYPGTSHSNPQESLELGIEEKKKSEVEELGFKTGIQLFCSLWTYIRREYKNVLKKKKKECASKIQGQLFHCF